MISAWGDDDMGSNSGSVYVYDAATGAQLHKLTASDGATNDGFGSALALDGNLLAVGSPGDDDFGSGSGAVYLFDITTGAELMKLTAADAAASMGFGGALDLDGGRLLVGAAGDDSININQGSAYLFDSGSGAQLMKLLSPNNGNELRFGGEVALSAGTALIGAINDSSVGLEGGAAHFYDVTTGNYITELLPSIGNGDDLFSWGLDIDGPRAVLSAYRAGSLSRGRGYL